MIHEVFAPGMHNRAYYHRYTDDNVDLCDVLSSFSYGAKVKLDELSRIMGLPGKPDGIDGSQVEKYFNAGRIQDIADYCVINTYRLWLRHELFRADSMKHNSASATGMFSDLRNPSDRSASDEGKNIIVE